MSSCTQELSLGVGKLDGEAHALVQSITARLSSIAGTWDHGLTQLSHVQQLATLAQQIEVPARH